jgi:hypothetical protein
MFNFTNKILTTAILGVAIVSTTLMTNISAIAQTVTPATAKNSLATPNMGVDMTTCVEVFNWDTYIADLRAAKAANKLSELNSNPFDTVGCVTQENFIKNGERQYTRAAAATGPNYNDKKGKIINASYTTGSAVTTAPTYSQFNSTSGPVVNKVKAVLGDLPVLGQFNNAGYKAQALDVVDLNGNVIPGANQDRLQLNDFLKVWSENELSTMYSSQTTRTGAPRLVYTDRDQLDPNKKNVYQGGPCTAANGIMSPRAYWTVPTGKYYPTGYLYDMENPLSTCRIRTEDGTLLEVDKNFEIYQFLYITDLPTAAQCNGLYEGAAFIPDYETCKTLYRAGKINFSIANPSSTANRRIAAYTYYGFYADTAFKCQTTGQTNCDEQFRFGPDEKLSKIAGFSNGFKNPDLNGPRKTFVSQATNEQIAAYYGITNNDQTLIAQRRQQYSNLINNLDGYTTYTR